MPQKVLLILVLVLVAFFALLFLSPGLLADNQEEFYKVLPLKATGTFSLDNVNGGVTITTWKEDKVEIKALKKTRKSAENLQKVKIEIVEAPDSIAVKTIYPKRENTGVSVDYDIRVPENVHLDAVETVNGGINISGPFGRVSASTVNGLVRVENASGDLRLTTTNGNINAINIVGKIIAETTNGSIELRTSALENELSAETVNGSITLAMSPAQEINAELDAQTVNGSISLDFPITLQGLQKSKHHLKGRIGQGGPLIVLETVNGSIHLKK